MASTTKRCEITEANNDNGHEGGGVAEDEGRKEVECVSSKQEQVRARRRVMRRRREMDLRARSAEQRRVEKEEEDVREKEEEEQRAQRERERQVRWLMWADREREWYMDRARRRAAGWEEE